MKNSQTFLLSAILICAIMMMAFVGITAYTEGDAQPTLLLFVGLATPVVTQVVTMIRGQKTLDVSTATDQKMDQLLNGSLQGKVAALERDVSLLHNTAARNAHRISNIETTQIEILAEISKLTPD